MNDLISRQAAIDICNNAIDLWHGQLGEGIVIAVKKKIEELPSAQPEPSMEECACCVLSKPERKKGKWIPVTRIEKWHKEEGLVGFPPEVKEFPQCTIEWVDATEPDEVDGLRCSECGTVYDFTEARNWCSECGAEMEGQDE